MTDPDKVLEVIATHARKGAAAAVNDAGIGVPHDITARINAAVADVVNRLSDLNEPVEDLAFATAYRLVRTGHNGVPGEMSTAENRHYGRENA